MGESINITMKVTEAELLDLIDQHVKEAVQPYEITVAQFVRVSKEPMTTQRAYNILERMVDQGKLVSRTAYDPTTGRSVKAYRKAEVK